MKLGNSRHSRVVTAKKCTKKCKAVVLMPYSTYCFFDVLIVLLNSLLRDGGQGFPPDTMNVAPGYSYWKIGEKYNQKKSLAASFPS